MLVASAVRAGARLCHRTSAQLLRAVHSQHDLCESMVTVDAAARYTAAHTRSLQDPEAFWGDAASLVDWVTPPERVLDDRAAPIYRWFAGGEMNTCHNALDRHVAAGRSADDALYWDSPVTGSKETWSFERLRARTAKLAGALARHGVGKGDRVVIYMPQVPDAVCSMLACARLGAVHSVVFGGFAPKELAARIDDARPKAVVAASCGVEPGRVVPYKPLLDEALTLSAHRVPCCLVLQRAERDGVGPVAALEAGRDYDLDEEVAASEEHACVQVRATDPLYVLYTSGTTGQPKGVLRDNGGHAVALTWSMANVMGTRPGETYWAASDIGWVVGHSYTVYAPLLAGCATVLYEGKPVGTPDASALWRVAGEYDVKSLFVAPTALRAVRREDPNLDLVGDHLDGGALRRLYVAGERADPGTVRFYAQRLGLPVIDNWWQSETGWPITNLLVGHADAGEGAALPAAPRPGSCGKPMVGYDVLALREDGTAVPDGDSGALAVRLPLPPGCLQTLYNDDERFVASYLDRFPGFYETGDAGFVDADGYVHVMARTDDVINVAGHRLSTGQLEEALMGVDGVAECAVIGVSDEVKGQLPVGLVVREAACEATDEALCARSVQAVREAVGPVAAFKQVAVVAQLPKTRSGKILRGTMVKVANGVEYTLPGTIENADAVDVAAAALQQLGYPRV